MANFLDRVIGAFSPETAARREAWRQYLEQVRSYDAGKTGRLNHNWTAISDTAEHTDEPYRDRIRARARDMERNSDIQNAVVSAFVRNVYGKGYTLRPRTGSSKTDAEILKAWKTWTKKENFDITGQQSFNAMLRMAVRRKKIDGGILLLKVFDDDGRYLPYKIQAVEVDQLDSTMDQLGLPGEECVRGGIRYNKYNRPLGYYIKQVGADGQEDPRPVYIPADQVIFYWTKTRPTQVREMSDMAPTLTRIRDINEYIEAESVKERVMACLSVFIKRTLPPSNLGRGTSITDEAGQQQYAGKTLTPGMIQYLNSGDDISVVNPSGQASDATAFVKQEMRLISSGQGLSYESVSRDMSESNYSSARQGAIEDGLTYQSEIEALMEVCDSIYETFILQLYATGKLGDRADFQNRREAYMSHEWIRAPKPWVDPAKEATATATALKTGQKTFAQIQAEGGHDWRDTVDEMADIIKYAKSKGVDLETMMTGGTSK